MTKFHFKQGESVILKPSTKASQRTQNRIFDNGPSFLVELEATQLSRTGSPIDGKICVLFRSNKNEWSGWLPVEEVHVLTSL
jgi:hypothetical protein